MLCRRAADDRPFDAEAIHLSEESVDGESGRIAIGCDAEARVGIYQRYSSDG
ncbi:hypothetical protein GCM10028798_35560 [Humibacter antri]